MPFEPPTTKRNIKNVDSFSINVRFENEEARIINEECNRLEINRSELIRLCLREHFTK